MPAQLVALDGGSRRRTVRGALRAYADQRLARSDGGAADDGAAVAVALEICERFFDISFANRSRGSRDIGVEWLIPGVSACYALFPYQCLVGSRVIDSFEREMRSLAEWCLEERLAADAEFSRFEREVSRTAPVIAQLHELQAALESSLEKIPDARARTLVDGRFRIERSSGNALRATVPGEREYGPLLLPRRFRRLFRPRFDVCLALLESVAGWIPVAGNIPVSQCALEEMLDHWSILRSKFRPQPKS